MRTFNYFAKGKLILLFAIASIFTFSCNKKDGGASGGGPIIPNPPPKPAPSITISVDRSTVDYGDSVKVSWNASSNSESITVNGDVKTSLSGSFWVTKLTANTTFTGVVTAAGFSPQTGSATVTVIPMSPTMTGLTAAPWQLIKIEQRPVGGTTWGELALLPCTNDDRHIFTIDKYYLWNRNTIPCNTGETNVTSTWKLLDSDSRLKKSIDTLTIAINGNLMVLADKKQSVTTGEWIETRYTYSK